MTGAQAMSTPTAGRPRRSSSKMLRMGAANVTMKLRSAVTVVPAAIVWPNGMCRSPPWDWIAAPKLDDPVANDLSPTITAIRAALLQIAAQSGCA